MQLRKRGKREGGFTLIELIAVVIILGILAAIIVPKYLDMTSSAKEAAYKGALNEGVARFNMAYSQYIMETQKTPTSLGNLENASLLGSTTDTISIGDYQITYGGGGTGNNVTLTLKNAAGTTTLSNNSIPWPN